MKEVSFDFDGTLEFQSIQNYAKELMEKGFEVHVTTSRWEDVTKYPFKVENHNDLFKVTDEIGIKRENIHFTNMEYKHKFLKNTDFIVHIDDNTDEVKFITMFTDVFPVDLFSHNWKYLCNTKLGINK